MNKRKLALVCLVLLASVAATNTIYAKSYIVTQNHKQFYLNGNKVDALAIKAGDSIKFLNEDKLFHNIFSMSKVMPFNIGVFGTGESDTIAFNKTGTIAVECGIHPRMMLEVDVGK